MSDFEQKKQQLISYYQDLLELQYNGKPKARNHVRAICESLLADMILWKMQEQCMNVDVSIGVQLDIIGKWVGVDRYFKGSAYEGKRWYAYYDWNEEDQPNGLQGGLWDWNTENEQVPILTYDWIMTVKNKINDNDFRFLIKLKIIKNETVLTCKNIDEQIKRAFDGIIRTVWGECLQLTYEYPSNRAAIMELAKKKNLLPHPCGVDVKLQEI